MKHSKLKKILKTTLFIVLCLILLAVIRIGSLLIHYQNEAKSLISQKGASAFRSSQTSILYDCNGNIITSFSGEKDMYYLTSNQIPYMVKLAFVTTEDRKFYDHSGVDFKAVLRATLSYLQNKGEITQGGSTITQQLSRNIFLSHEVSMERKLKEMFIARELEKTYSKDELLEFYINNIYFGNSFYGIEAASKGYFNKSVTKLSLSEMIFLCAIPNNPDKYNPFLYMEQTLKRRDRILKQMLEQNDINQEMYDQAVAETITLNPSIKVKHNYIETYARFCATEALMQQSGFSFRYSFSSQEEKDAYDKRYQEYYTEFSNKLFTGGYRIYTSLDLDMQDLLQKTLDDQLASYTEKKDGVYEFQGAATCIDNANGYVKAIVGGRSQKFKGYTLNRAYQSHRQPGSTIKPILTYTPLFERGYTPDTKVMDEKTKGGPTNSPNVYEGEMTIRTAVEKSKNTVAWNLFEKLTPGIALSYLYDMNFSKIDSRDYVSAVSIGGMTYGTSTLEMASAYATLENDGIFRNPTCIIKITDADGNTLLENLQTQKRVYTVDASRMMTNILKGVLTNGTGRNYQVGNAICAAKTGTTNSNRDAWLVGYSTYYTTAVWVGYDYPKEIADGFGNTCAGTIWQTFMNQIHQNLERIDFAPYAKPTQEETTRQTSDSTETKEDEEGEESTFNFDETLENQEENPDNPNYPDDDDPGKNLYTESWN